MSKFNKVYKKYFTEMSDKKIEQDLLKYEEVKKWIQEKDVHQFDPSDSDSMAIHKEFVAKLKEFVNTFQLSSEEEKRILMSQLASTPSVGQILNRLYNAIMAGAGLAMGKGKL